MSEATAWRDFYPPGELLEVSCPGCGADEHRPQAREFGILVARCEHCELVYTRTPVPASQGHYAVSREEMLSKYGEVLAGRAPHPRDRTYDEHLETLERFVPRGRLLDVGSHAGFFLRRARARGWNVSGIEPSPTTSGLARSELGLDVRNCGVEDAPFDPGSFDAVTMTDVLEHVPNPNEVLTAIHRLLRPGGHLFVKVPNARYVLAKARTVARIPGAVEDVFDAREHLVYYDDVTLARTLKNAGYEVVHLAVPSPIQAGGPARRLVRGAGAALARLMPRGVATPLATDLVAVARR